MYARQQVGSSGKPSQQQGPETQPATPRRRKSNEKEKAGPPSPPATKNIPPGSLSSAASHTPSPARHTSASVNEGVTKTHVNPCVWTNNKSPPASVTSAGSFRGLSRSENSITKNSLGAPAPSLSVTTEASGMTDEIMKRSQSAPRSTRNDQQAPRQTRSTSEERKSERFTTGQHVPGSHPRTGNTGPNRGIILVGGHTELSPPTSPDIRGRSNSRGVPPGGTLVGSNVRGKDTPQKTLPRNPIADKADKSRILVGGRDRQTLQNRSLSPDRGRTNNVAGVRKTRSTSPPSQKSQQAAAPRPGLCCEIDPEGVPYRLPDFSTFDRSLARKFDKDIREFQETVDGIMKTREAEYETVIHNITNLVRQIWPKANVETYGSLSTTLALPSSDIDIFIEISNSGDNTQLLPGLRKFSEILESSNLFRAQSVKFIETAIIPVIKLLTKKNVPVDLTCLCPGSRHTGKNARDLVCGLVKEISPLRPLALVLKQKLYKEGLNNQYTGGVGSFSLVLILATFLKAPGVLTESVDLGVLMLRILDFFATTEFGKVVISINKGMYLPDTNQHTNGAPMLIADPTDATHNIAASSFLLWQVQSLLAACRVPNFVEDLLTFVKQMEKRRSNSL
eukprot:TRINITY_DN2712_c0_g7_i2.p1 TRINITY_DN2712_c0_g7~~TRINITY_DN2712_c0_g7_i2.p1  ORF type:complete len:621 (+),score=85.52 TRINITY_DN2712_c0_g7_i2:411-2273(+)